MTIQEISRYKKYKHKLARQKVTDHVVFLGLPNEILSYHSVSKR